MWIEKKENGSYVYREYYDHPRTGKRMKVSVTLPKDNIRYRKQAQAVLTEKINTKLAELGKPSEASSMTLEQLVTLYRADQKRTLSDATYRRNYFAMESLKSILGADTRLSALTANYIREQLTSNGDGPGTINERLTRLKALIRWAYANDYIDDVRFLDKLKKYPNPEKRERLEEKFLEREELSTLIDAMSVTTWRLMTELLAYSGLRIGEALALRQQDIDLKSKVIRVRHTLDPVTFQLVDPKTPESNRDVYMQKNLFRTMIKLLSDVRHRLEGYQCKSDLLFFGPNGEPLQYFAYNKYLKETSEVVLGRQVTTHIMRHTHTALMAEAGVPLDAISRRLGHADSAVTRKVYFHVTERMKEKDNEYYELLKLS